MVSVELGDMEDVARQYCDQGELSRFLRQLIKQYDTEQKQPLTTQQKNESILQTLLFFILGSAFFIIACSTIFNILITITAAFLILCSLFLFIYTYLNIKKYKKTDEVKKRWI